MATSEYIRRTYTPKTDGGQSVSKWSSRRQQPRLLSPAVVASLQMMLSDALAIVMAFAGSLLLRAMLMDKAARIPGLLHDVVSTQMSPASLAWFMLSYLLVVHRCGLYSPVPLASGLHEIRLIAQGCLAAGLLLCGGLYMTGHLSISRMLVVLLVALSMAMLSVRRTLWRRARFRQFERGLETRNVVVLGTNHLSHALGQHIENDYRLGCKLRGYVAVTECETTEVRDEQILGGIELIRQLTRKHFIDEIVIAEPCPPEQAIRLVKEARELDVDIRAISGFYGGLTMNTPVEYLGVFPVVSLHRRDPRVVSLMLKRGVDIALSLFALMMVAPMMIAVAIAIRIEGGGSVFYVSDRIGKRGRVFPCLKFRTMVKDAEEMKKGIAALNERDGILFKVTNDPRITKVGKILRKYSLDELPQFINVLRGEMSMVGPRPPIASEVAKYELEHFRRLEVLPGVTGLWQVQARQDSSFAKYIALDTAYVENWSFWLDLKIILSTAGVVFKGTGT
jgi:exopolysaccharide biosynthesis polyprenyl glycosylphosphotransferase